jgi:hypothetical protein
MFAASHLVARESDDRPNGVLLETQRLIFLPCRAISAGTDFPFDGSRIVTAPAYCALGGLGGVRSERRGMAGTLRTPFVIQCNLYRPTEGPPMLRREADSAIIDEWMSLPESERLTEQQAAHFALQMKRKYPFEYVGGDRYLEIRRMMIRHENRISAADTPSAYHPSPC